MPTTPKLLIVVPVDNAPRLTVQMLRDAKASNGQEFLSGTRAGFVPESAVSMVLCDVGRAFVFDEKAGKEWARALIDLGGLGERDDEKILSLLVGPFAEHVRDLQAQIDEAQANAAKRREAEDAAKKLAEEEKAVLDAMNAETARLQAEAAAKAAEELKAKQDAEEQRIAAEDAKLKADGLARASADVSNPDVSADAMANKEPAPTPPAPEPSTRRGNRTPRS